MPRPRTDQIDLILDYIRGHGRVSDLTAKAVQMRLRRAAHHFDTETSRRLARKDMELWEMELLCTLLRNDGALTMGQLNEAAQLTPGAITNRITRLEERGHVARSISATDRRQVMVTLTDAGRDRVDAVIEAYNAAETELFHGIDPELLQRLADDLRELLLAADATSGTVDR